MEIIVKGKRNLPHLMPIGSSFFVTWRLFGSIPKEKIIQFKAQLANDLEAFCVMSNHVHALFNFAAQLPEKMIDFEENDYVQLSKIMKLIKGSTAFYANKTLGRKGSFWDEESYDTFIRSEKHRQTVKDYIINNPVKAKICKHWKDYPYTYLQSTTDFSL